MKLEEGKYYRCRNGEVVGPLRHIGVGPINPKNLCLFAANHQWRANDGVSQCCASYWDAITEVTISDVLPTGDI